MYRFQLIAQIYWNLTVVFLFPAHYQRKSEKEGLNGNFCCSCFRILSPFRAPGPVRAPGFPVLVAHRCWPLWPLQCQQTCIVNERNKNLWPLCRKHTHSTHTPIRTHLRTWLFSAVRNELTWRIINIKCYTYKLNKMAQLKLPARLLLLSTTRLMTWPSSSQSKYIPHIYMLHIYVCVCVCMLWGYTYVLGDFCVCGSHYYILAL